MAEKQGSRCETLARRGAPFFLYRFRRRYALLASLALVSALLFFGSFFIWEFDIEGEAPYSRQSWLIAFFPAIFMLAVSSSFIMIAPEGFRLPHTMGYGIAAAITLLFSVLFLVKVKRAGNKDAC